MKSNHTKRLVSTLAIGLSLAATPILLSSSPRAEVATNSEAKSECHAAIQKIIAQRNLIQPLGIIVANLYDLEGEVAQYAKANLAMSDRLRVLFVEPNSLADRLGLLPGDELIQFNDLYVSRGKTALEQLEERIVPQIDWSDTVQATIIRDGFGQTHTVENANPMLTKKER